MTVPSDLFKRLPKKLEFSRNLKKSPGNKRLNFQCLIKLLKSFRSY